MLLRAASSPSQSLTRQIPPFVAARHLPPERGKSFLKGGALGKTGKFSALPRPLPLTDSPGRGRWHEVPEGEQGGCERSEQTESARPLTLKWQQKSRAPSFQRMHGFESLCVYFTVW